MPAIAGTVFDQIKTSGHLACGVVIPAQDWDKAALHGDMSPFSSEICKAIAQAIIERKEAVRIHPYPTERSALQAVAEGRIDLAVGVTPHVGDVASGQLLFGPVLFYDAQAVMVRANAHITRLSDVAGKKLCTIDGTRSEAVVLHELAKRGIAAIGFSFQEAGEMESGFLTGHCQAVAAPMSRLGDMRATYGKELRDTIILPDLLGVEPASVAYAPGDGRFAAAVDATIAVLIAAELAGLTQDNVRSAHDEGDMDRAALLGIEGGLPAALGLRPHWAADVIASFGNYGTVFDRTLGKHAPARLDRGPNALWRDGGLMVPGPVR